MPKHSSKSYFKTYILILLVLCSSIINSCKKDNTSFSNPSLSASITTTKTWYQSNFPVSDKKRNTLVVQSAVTGGTGLLDLSQLIEPDWQHGSSYNRFNSSVWELPINPASTSIKMSLSNSPDYKAVYKSKYSKLSFLILKDSLGYHAYVMTILADSAYLKGDLKKLDGNKYNKRDSDFSGAVLYSTPKGKFISGWFYKKGVITGALSAGGETYSSAYQSKNGTGQNLTTQSLHNNTVSITQTTVCQDWTQTATYMDNNGNPVTTDPVYLGTVCTTTYTTSDSGGGTGSSGSPSGGGTSGGGSTTAPTPCTVPAPASAVESTGPHLQVAVVQSPPTTTPIDGGTGYPPPTSTPPPCASVPPSTTVDVPTDPCDGVKSNAAATANKVAGNSTSVANSFAAAIQYSNNGQESAFHIDNISGTYTASAPVPTSESAAYLNNSVDANTVAVGHDHDAGSFPTPSPFDIYSIGELAVANKGKINIDYVLSASKKYAVVVNDIAKFSAFFAKYDESNLAKDANGNFTGDFSGNSVIGQEVFNVGQDSFYANPISSTNPVAAELNADEVGLAYFVSHYDTGITLLVADSSGNFHPLHVSSTTQNGKTFLTASPCN